MTARHEGLRELAGAAVDMLAGWEESWGPYEAHPASAVDADRLAAAWGAYAERMQANLPFFHPRYAGQMLKPPHPVAAAAYLAAMLVNPNNHALDASQATSPMEVEVVEALARMFGLEPPSLGHLTSSGTIANLEALWVARELHPGKAVVHSSDAHYTHGRMCQVLGVEARAVQALPDGRADLDAIEAQLRAGGVGTVVLTAGTTGVGAVDPIHEALAWRERYGVRIHVDAAYGGFFALLAGTGLVPAAPYEAIGGCDSIVVDPHKHGLQPYGCGAVLFADPGVGRLYVHDSPYTYFTSDELHLGEISLECSRAGAAAGALWMTLQALPLRADDGLGPILAAGLRAAAALAQRLEDDPDWTRLVRPELDIVTYAPAAGSLSEVDAASERILHTAMGDADDPWFLSTLRVGADAFCALHPGHDRDADAVRVLRSVLMKPEHELAVDALHRRLGTLASAGSR
jgi:glutamate/tyrosine decarboxylase-like PLP-dependent enzyme